MNIDLADVTLHVDETLDSNSLAELDDALRRFDGVVSVHVNPDRPHLFILEYNPAKVSSEQLLE
ncbi:MAG: ATP-binding protein, partial [Chromatiales bacterium]